jgi:tetratricopeptide (TPR) repeat protein
MSVLPSPVVRALGLTIAFATAAGAQDTQKACEINESKPGQIGRATLAVQIAASATSPEAASKQLTSAVKSLTDNAEKMDNQVGRHFVLGKALVLWSIQPGVGLVAKRGPLGFSANPEGSIDLAIAIDSSFKIVEAAHPECIAETSRWRGQKSWIDLVNTAIERMNAEDVDSAEAVAQRAIVLNPYAPYGYVVLANVMQKRNKSTEAFGLYRKAVEMSARDTAYNEIRRQSLVYLGNLAVDSAELAANAAARKPYIDAARAAYEQVLQDKEAGEFSANARAGLCRVAIASGDTASLRQTYKDPLDSPATFVYSDLMNAGVCLARAEMVPEAAKLFQAAYEKNPYHRDALSNLAIMLLQSDKHDQSLPLAQRLVAVEPNNPENLQLLVLSYAGIAKRARDARLGASRPATSTKAGARPAARAAPPKLSAAASDSLFRIEKAYTDSAVSTNARKENLAIKVQLSDFNTSPEKASVSGTVTNQGTSPKPVKIVVEFLNKDGQVVATETASLADIAPKGTSRFSVTTTIAANVTAFKYVIH